MRIGVVSLALTASLWPGPATAAQAEPSTTRTIALLPVESGRIDPSLAAALPLLLESALESGEGYEVSAAREGAEWTLRMVISGKGPWKLSARAEPSGRRLGLRRITTRKHLFSGRGQMAAAVDSLAAELDAAWREADRSSPAGIRPAPLARALSASPPAVDAYLAALTSIRSGDPSRGRAALEQALAADPGFCLAAVERAYIDLTRGDPDPAPAPGTACAEGAVPRPPLPRDAGAVLDLLLAGDAAGALRAAETLSARAPHLSWARTLRGLTLSLAGRRKDSVEDWRAAAAADPDDPRALMWLGQALMAAGEFGSAAEVLGRALQGWPDLLRAYTLQAEAQARLRETAAAKQTITTMKSAMSSRGLVPTSDDLNPDLMLGSIELLEGHTVAALRTFEDGLTELERAAVPFEVADTLRSSIVEMRRDLITSRDPVTRRRQVEDAAKAIEVYQSSLPPEHRVRRPWELLRLRGLVTVREGNTVEAWKIVEEIRSHAGEPGYSEYYDAYLSAAIMLKEGDEEGCTAQFERAAKARGKIVDLIDLAQMQGSIKKYQESRRTFEEVARRLERYDPQRGAPPAGQGELGELILTQPHLAALVPIYHYTRARLAYETGNATESRYHFNRMLKYLQRPDDELLPLVREAVGRGAHPE